MKDNIIRVFIYSTYLINAQEQSGVLRSCGGAKRVKAKSSTSWAPAWGCTSFLQHHNIPPCIDKSMSTRYPCYASSHHYCFRLPVIMPPLHISSVGVLLSPSRACSFAGMELIGHFWRWLVHPFGAKKNHLEGNGVGPLDICQVWSNWCNSYFLFFLLIDASESQGAAYT